MAGTLPPVLGGQLPAPRRPARRNEVQEEKTRTHQATEEMTDDEHREEHWNAAGHDALGAGDRPDPRLRRAAQPRLRRLDQARAAQTLAGGSRGLVDGGL